MPPFRQPALSEDAVRQALADCFDPQTSLNLIDLGLVHSIDLNPDPEAPGAGIPGVPQRFQLRVVLLARPGEEPEAEAMRQAIVHNRLAGLESLSRITVETSPEPAWSEQRLSPHARRHLGLDPGPFAILNQPSRRRSA